MPKSFLVKNNLRVKSCPSSSDEEENVLTAEDEQNIKSKETQLLWKRSCSRKNEMNAEFVAHAGNRTSSAPSSMPVMLASMHHWSESETINETAVEVSQAATQPGKLAKHEKLGSSKQNAIFSSFKPDFVHHASANTQLQCDQCKKAYTTNSALVKHQRYYCNLYQKKSFTCKYCDKVYMSLGALKMHIRTHTLPCQCMICGKAFSRPWLLQGHIRTHTGEKPYQCSNCCRAFADRSNLRAHLQTHSDVKKYKCERCAKTFSRMSLLLKHENAGGCSVIKV